MLWTLVLEAAFILAVFAVAAELLARGTEDLERYFGQGIAGGVILGLLNALPEAVVVVVAVLGQSYSVAMGAALGGTVMVFTLIMGFVGVVYSARWGKGISMKGDYRTDLAFLLIGIVALALVAAYGVLNILSGGALVIIYVAYVFYRYRTAKSIRKAAPERISASSALRIATYLIAGGVMIIALSGPLVDVIKQTAAAISIPTLWLSLLLVPIAGELPECLTGYRLARKSIGGGSTALVSFAGGKLVNITLLVGAIGILAGAPVDIGSALPAFGSAVVAGLVALLLIGDGILTKGEAVGLGVLYFVIVAFTFAF